MYNHVKIIQKPIQKNIIYQTIYLLPAPLNVQELNRVISKA